MRFKVSKRLCPSLTPEEIDASGIKDKRHTFVELPDSANTPGSRRRLRDWHERATPALLLSLDLDQYRREIKGVRWKRHRVYMEAKFSFEDFDRVMAHYRVCSKEGDELRRRERALTATGLPLPPKGPGRPKVVKMPFKRKAIYAPIYFERGHNLSEIAGILGVSENIIAPWLSLDRLKELFKKYKASSMTELCNTITAEELSYARMDAARRGRLDSREASETIKGVLGRRVMVRPKADDEDSKPPNSESKETLDEARRTFLGDEEEPEE